MYSLQVQEATQYMSLKQVQDAIARLNEPTRGTLVPQSGESNLCHLCYGVNCDVKSLVRSCLCDRRPCEGHQCSCLAYQACSTCLARQLWENSNTEMKKLGVLRSKCAFCKAEFCVNDIVLLPKAPQSQTAKPKTPRGKRN